MKKQNNSNVSTFRSKATVILIGLAASAWVCFVALVATGVIFPK